jgi:hypothetical protein
MKCSGESMPFAISLMPTLAPSFDFCAIYITARMAYSQAFENMVFFCCREGRPFLIKEFFIFYFVAISTTIVPCLPVGAAHFKGFVGFLQRDDAPDDGFHLSCVDEFSDLDQLAAAGFDDEEHAFYTEYGRGLLDGFAGDDVGRKGFDDAAELVAGNGGGAVFAVFVLVSRSPGELVAGCAG